MFIAISSLNIYTQKLDKYNLSYKTIEGKNILLPTFDNIFNLSVMKDEKFKEIIAYYKYVYDSKKDENTFYCVEGNKDGKFLISKNGLEILFVWMNTPMDTGDIENNFLENGSLLKNDNGSKYYLIKEEGKGFVFKLEVVKIGKVGVLTFDIFNA